MLAHVPSTAVPYYQAIFSLYNSSPGVSRAVPVVNGSSGSFVDTTGNQGCGKNGFSGTYVSGNSGPTFGGASGVSCAVAFGTTASSVNTEYYIDGRVDWNINAAQKLYFRISRDSGVQASSTNPVNTLFSGRSPQPWVIPQLNYTYAITQRLVNNFILNGNYYSVVGGANTAAQLKLIPLAISISDGGASGGGFPALSPTLNTGRIGQQLGIIDDLSWEIGKHTLQFGVNNRENRISSTANKRHAACSYAFGNLLDFAKGNVTDSKNFNSFSQSFPLQPSVHIRVDSLGFYAQDEWKLRDNLNVTFGTRFEYQGNPWCKENCYSRTNTEFLANGYSASASTPYNATLQTGINKDFKQFEGVITEPRFGIAYSPFGEGKTVVRGGIGLFANTIAASIAANVFGNSPNNFTPKVTTGIVGLTADAGTSQVNAIASNNAFQAGFAGGSTLTQFQAAVGPGVTFSTPKLYVNPNKFHTIKVLEWSLEVEQPLTKRDVFTVSYAGNHSYNYALSNAAANGASTKGFGGLAKVNPDPRFATVTQIYDTGYGNYNGLTLAERHAFAHGFQGQAAATPGAKPWLRPTSTTQRYIRLFQREHLHPLATRGIIMGRPRSTHATISPPISSMRRQSFSRALAMTAALGGWKFGGKLYLYSGRPFSVTNGGINGATAGLSSTFSGSILADLTQPSVLGTHCSRAAVNLSGHTPCLSTHDFAAAAAQTDWGNTKPNSFRGPGFFSVAAQLSKSIAVTEHQHFEIGADAYNLFNHPNFGLPTSDVNSGNFGLITSTQSSPTSIYGTGQGSAVSGRVLVVFGKLIF